MLVLTLVACAEGRNALQVEVKGQPNTVELIRQDAVPLLPATASPAAPEDSWRASSEFSYHNSSDEFRAIHAERDEKHTGKAQNELTLHIYFKRAP